MSATRYTSDGRELFKNESEYTLNGKPAYRFCKTVKGKTYATTAVSLDKMREKAADLLKEISRLEKNTRKAVIKDNTVRAIADVGSDENADSNMKVFSSEIFGDVRIILRDNEPWFVAADVCRALELSNPTMSLSRLDDDEKMTLNSTEGHSGQRGGAQSYTVVSESGLYSLVLGSRKKEAKEFKRWITHEVLPLIRKYGVYVDDETARKPTEEQIQILKKVEEEKQKLRKQNFELTKENAYLKYDCKIKRDAYDGLGTISFNQLSSIYGISSAYSFLEKSGIIRKENGMTCLTDEYKNKGYDAIGWKGGKPFMLWTALGYCEVVYKTMLEQYGMKPIKKLYVF